MDWVYFQCFLFYKSHTPVTWRLHCGQMDPGFMRRCRLMMYHSHSEANNTPRNSPVTTGRGSASREDTSRWKDGYWKREVTGTSAAASSLQSLRRHLASLSCLFSVLSKGWVRDAWEPWRPSLLVRRLFLSRTPRRCQGRRGEKSSPAHSVPGRPVSAQKVSEAASQNEWTVFLFHD